MFYFVLSKRGFVFLVLFKKADALMLVSHDGLKIVGKRQEHKGQLLLQILLVERVNLLEQALGVNRIIMGLKASVVEHV